MRTDAEYAATLDRDDPLAAFRERFYRIPGQLYFDGNSLGLLSRDAEATLQRTLDDWRERGILGWLQGDPAWFTLGETLGRMTAPLIGATPDEVVVTGSTTVNLHALVATFYQPTADRRVIVATALDFPSDQYALNSQIALRGGDPARDLVLAPSRDARTIDEDDIIAALDPAVALLVVPSVLYRSGQLLDIARLAAAARERGIPIGVDCCHSIGVVPHHFDDWAVDFACWCGYKYLNGGPGSTAGLYVNRRHHGRTPALAGWWGSDKARQFDMASDFAAAADAGAWQVSTVPVLSSAPLLGSLTIMAEAGIDAMRAKSLFLTDYLIGLIEATGLTEAPYSYAIGTPRLAIRRGGHVAVEHEAAPRVVKALRARGVVPDFRPPNVIRLAPAPLYTTFTDVWQVVQQLRAIVDDDAHRHEATGRELVA